MWRYGAGGLAALLLAAAGIVVVNRHATPGASLAAQPPRTASAAQDQPLPDRVAEASDKTREQKRFDRYDKDRDGKVTRDEYLLSRRKAYAKLDANHDGTLSFDEWAAKTTAKFAAADADRSGTMTPTEFVTTAPKRKTRVRPDCTQAASAGEASTDEG